MVHVLNDDYLLSSDDGGLRQLAESASGDSADADDFCGAGDVFKSYLQLAVICMCSFKVAGFVASLPVISLPRGSGFLLTGMAANLAGMVTRSSERCLLARLEGGGAATKIDVFLPVSYLSMAFIAYATGSECLLDRYRGHIKHVVLKTAMIMTVTFLVIFVALFGLLDVEGVLWTNDEKDSDEPVSTDTDSTSYTGVSDMMKDSNARTSIALIVAAILVSRSPASAISIVGEMRANGTFTKTALGVTICMYVGAVLFYSIMNAVVSTISGDAQGEETVLIFVSVIVSIILSVCFGFMLGYALFGIIKLPIRPGLKRCLRLRSPLYELYIKAFFSLLLGLALFSVRIGFSQIDFDGSGYVLKIEPLLACLIGGAAVVNLKKGAMRMEWKRMCAACSPYIYCTFFTLGGCSLNLSALAENIGPAAIVMVMRFFGIITGASIAGFALRDPHKFTKISWMNYITQAGVALGFAQEVRVDGKLDPEFRDYVYTLTVAVVCINQIVGPPFFKAALRLSGEAFIDRIGGTQLVTVDGQVPQVQVKKVKWEVRAGPGGTRVAVIAQSEVGHKTCEGFDEQALSSFLGEPGKGADGGADFAFISMLEDDAANFEACKLAQQLYSVRRTIVQQIDPQWKNKFNEVGGLVVDPADIVVGSLEQYLGSAQAAAVLLHNDPLAEVVKVNIDMDCAGWMIQQIQLPQDVQVLEVHRARAAVVPRPFTKIQYGDELTLCGKPNSLSLVTAIKKGRVVLVNGGAQSMRMPKGQGLNKIANAGNFAVQRGSYHVPDQTSITFEVSRAEEQELEMKARR